MNWVQHGRRVTRVRGIRDRGQSITFTESVRGPLIMSFSFLSFMQEVNVSIRDSRPMRNLLSSRGGAMKPYLKPTAARPMSISSTRSKFDNVSKTSPAFGERRSLIRVQVAKADLETYFMASVGKKRSGLPFRVYVGEKNASHGPRLKVPQAYNNFISQGEICS